MGYFMETVAIFTKNELQGDWRCMRLHNFIFDSREENLSQSDSSDSLEIDRSVFSDEMRRFLSINLNKEVVGVRMGERTK